MIQLLWEFSAILVLILLAGIPIAALFRRRHDDAFWIYAMFYGICAWVVGLNLIFNLAGSFQIAVYGLLALFVPATGYALWHRRAVLGLGRQAGLAFGIAGVATIIVLLPAGLIGPDAYIGGFGGDSNQYARGADFLRLYAEHAPFHPFDGFKAIEPNLMEWRPGPSMLTAMGAELVSRDPFPSLSILSGLSNGLAALAGFLLARRHVGRGPALWCAVGFLAINAMLGYNAFQYYSGKALAMPLVLVTIVAFVEFSAAPLSWRRIGALSLLLAALIQLMFEAGLLIAPAAGILFVLSFFRKRWRGFLAGSVVVLALAGIATPNIIRMYNYGFRGAVADSVRVEEDDYWQRVAMPAFALFPMGMSAAVPIRPTLDSPYPSIEAPAQSAVARVAQTLAGAPGNVLASPGEEIGAGLRAAYLTIAAILFLAALAGHAGNWSSLRPAQRVFLLVAIIAPLVVLTPLGFFMGYKGRYNLWQVLSIFLVYFVASGAMLAAVRVKWRRVKPFVYASLGAWCIATMFSWAQIYNRALFGDILKPYYDLRPGIVDVASFLDKSADGRTLILIRDDRGGILKEDYGPTKYMLNYYLRRHPTLSYSPGVHFRQTMINGGTVERLGDATKFCRILAIESGSAALALDQPLFRSGEFAVVNVDLNDETLPRREILLSVMDSQCSR